MKILITGATGFIGKRIAQRLAEKGHNVVASGRKKTSDSGQRNNITWQMGDLLDSAFVENLSKEIDVVIHCAGKAGTWGDYQSYYEANVKSTDLLMKAAQNNQVKKFVIISSPSIYFEFKNQNNLSEDFLPENFSNHYAKTKYISERNVLEANTPQFQTIALRPRFVIGAGDNNILPRLIELQKNHSLYQIGSGKNKVSVTSISNLLDAIELCLSTPYENMGEVYNIADEEPVEFWSFVDAVLKNLNLDTKKKKLSRPMMLSLASAMESVCRVLNLKKEPRLQKVPLAVLSQDMTLDISKAKKQLGYLPKQNWQDAVNEFCQWRNR